MDEIQKLDIKKHSIYKVWCDYEYLTSFLSYFSYIVTVKTDLLMEETGEPTNLHAAGQ